MSERETGTEPDSDAALTVLRGIWSATGQTAAELEERFGRRPGKVCKNMKNIGFGGMPGDPIDGDTNTPVDEDVRAAWRRRLERDGKLHPRGRSVGETLNSGEWQ
ncbi:MAG: hypothetical protein EKK42_35405 [Pseudonocardiaceae bacterium]|nr:MAG: hypothetical protein EKK42_35405 [Pseudonocardiaceae bacterium]